LAKAVSPPEKRWPTMRLYLSWWWLTAAVLAPTVFGLIAARPLWRRGDSNIGAVVGAGIAFLVIITLVGREYAELIQFRIKCQRLATPCFVVPEDFYRYAIYCGIGFLDVMALFVIGGRVEKRRERKTYAPEWR
jgi:hypothetical protein